MHANDLKPNDNIVYPVYLDFTAPILARSSDY